MDSEITLKVEGMGCQNCVKAVEKAVTSAVPGAKVEVILAEGLVRVAPGQVEREVVAKAIASAGYDVLPG